MQVTNYSNSKQNQPNFGMVLDFTPEAIKALGKRNFKKLAGEVKDLVTKGDEFELTVKGSKLDDGGILLSVDEGIALKAENSCMAFYKDVKAYLYKFNNFFSPLTKEDYAALK